MNFHLGETMCLVLKETSRGTKLALRQSMFGPDPRHEGVPERVRPDPETVEGGEACGSSGCIAER